MDKRTNILGLIMIILGLIFLLDNLNILRFEFFMLWPLLVILGGTGFWLGFLTNRKNLGLIMPGTILIIYGALFMYCALTDWDYMRILWPVFLLGPGIGFFLMYAFSEKKDRGLLLPGGILTLLSLLFAFSHLNYLRYWPVILIIIGIVLLLRPSKKKNEGD